MTSQTTQRTIANEEYKCSVLTPTFNTVQLEKDLKNWTCSLPDSDGHPVMKRWSAKKINWCAEKGGGRESWQSGQWCWRSQTTTRPLLCRDDTCEKREDRKSKCIKNYLQLHNKTGVCKLLTHSIRKYRNISYGCCKTLSNKSSVEVMPKRDK